MTSRAAREQAYVDYVTARYTYLRRIAFAISGDANRAEDLLQTALTKLYVAWPRVHGDGREDAYVRQILVRADIDHHRRPWRRERAAHDLPDVPAPEPLGVEDRSALFDALQALPPMQRRTVLLRHWLGLSVRETAHELGIGEGTVKSHSSRGLEALRSVLAEDHTPS